MLMSALFLQVAGHWLHIPVDKQVVDWPHPGALVSRVYPELQEK